MTSKNGRIRFQAAVEMTCVFWWWHDNVVVCSGGYDVRASSSRLWICLSRQVSSSVTHQQGCLLHRTSIAPRHDLRRQLSGPPVDTSDDNDLSLVRVWEFTFLGCLLDPIQWCRSVVKYGGSGSVRSSHQTVSGASKNYFYLPFLTRVFHPWWCETCGVIQQQFWMKECDILRVEAYYDPPTYFQGSRSTSLLLIRLHRFTGQCSRFENKPLTRTLDYWRRAVDSCISSHP